MVYLNYCCCIDMSQNSFWYHVRSHRINSAYDPLESMTVCNNLHCVVFAKVVHWTTQHMEQVLWTKWSPSLSVSQYLILPFIICLGSDFFAEKKIRHNWLNASEDMSVRLTSTSNFDIKLCSGAILLGREMSHLLIFVFFLFISSFPPFLFI